MLLALYRLYSRPWNSSSYRISVVCCWSQFLGKVYRFSSEEPASQSYYNRILVHPYDTVAWLRVPVLRLVHCRQHKRAHPWQKLVCLWIAFLIPPLANHDMPCIARPPLINTEMPCMVLPPLILTEPPALPPLTKNWKALHCISTPDKNWNAFHTPDKKLKGLALHHHPWQKLVCLSLYYLATLVLILDGHRLGWAD